MVQNDRLYMERCLQLARLGADNVSPNPMVGAVLVYQDTIIGEGYHQQYGGPHAEVNCINSVKDENKKLICKSTIFVSLEPCAHFGKTPPCADLIIKNQIPRVVVGCRDPFKQVDGKGIDKLKAAGIEVVMSELNQECINLNKRFFTFHQQKRPFIILKWAETADHFIGFSEGERLLISGKESNILTHKWRSEEAGILVGTVTAQRDQPSLTTRNFPGKNPIRLLIDRNLKIESSNPIFQGETPTIVFNESKDGNEDLKTYVKVDTNKEYIETICRFCYEHNLNSILVEGGNKVLQTFIDNGIWDECRIITNKKLYAGMGIQAPTLTNKIAIFKTENLANDEIRYIKNLEIKSE